MRTPLTRAAMASTAVAALLAASGCAADDDPATGSGITGDISVFAAASLTESFNTIKDGFIADNPNTTVTFNFAGSSELANQINQGAPVDVFASAAPANMDTVTEAGNGYGDPTVFIKNELVIAVPQGNPKGVDKLADLADPNLKVALCAAEVPCGAAANTALDVGGVSMTPVTLEKDVKSALSKVTLGEVDAALVYRTDVEAADDKVDGVEFDESKQAINDYPIIQLKDAPNPEGAQAFIDYVQSPESRDVLLDAGFTEP